MAYTDIDKPTDYFNTITWTGDGNSTRSLTGVGFQPDWVWVKCRNQGTFSHTLSDSVRGATKTLLSNATTTERTNYSFGYLTSFDSDGFSATAGSNSIEQYNTSSDTYVGWNWLADNTSGSSNTDGSITSTVSANTTSGFSIVSFTGTGSALTAGHGLGVKPSMIIAKSTTIANNWPVYHKDVGAEYALWLDRDIAKEDNSIFFNDTEPTSSVFSLGNWSGINTSGSGIIAYCFAEKKGFSKFGSYTGAGVGTFVYTGFKPAWVMIKRTDSTGGWSILDNKRLGYNGATYRVFANLSDAEEVADKLDLLSNGFKLNVDQGTLSSPGASYIYMAFAENPFVTSGGIPTTAR